MLSSCLVVPPAVACDSTSVVVAGGTQGAMTVGALTTTLAGGADAFVIRYDSTGGELWAMTLVSTSSDIAYGVAYDSDGHIYATGIFRGTLTAGSTTLTSAGQSDAFVVKVRAPPRPQQPSMSPSLGTRVFVYGQLDRSTGSVLWAKSFGGTSTDKSLAIGISGSSVFVGGQFTTSMSVQGYDFTSLGGSDAFLLVSAEAGASSAMTGQSNAPSRLICPAPLSTPRMYLNPSSTQRSPQPAACTLNRLRTAVHC